MLTNDIKKGARIQLRNGWKAIVMDNKKGNIRCCRVFGYCDEIGDGYVWDWAAVEDASGNLLPITLTDKQKKARAQLRAMGF